MKTNVIETALPLVYRRKNEFEVLNGLDLSRKDELWGIQLTSGVMVALKCGEGNNVSETRWNKVKQFAEKMRLNGKSGSLPSRFAFERHWGTEEQTRFTATVEVLKENNIEADGYIGMIWCHETYYDDYPNGAYYFCLSNGDSDWDYKCNIFGHDRVALAFN